MEAAAMSAEPADRQCQVSDFARALQERFAAAMEMNSGTVKFVPEHAVAAEVARLVCGDGVVLVDEALPDLAAALRALDVDAGEVSRAEVTGLRGAGSPQPVGLEEVLATAGAGVTAAVVAVAATGSVVIGPGKGSEGLLGTLPPHHVVVLPASLIEPEISDALTRMAPLVAGPGNRLVFVSGPSRTSDIELTTVVGVHGPLRLDVLVVTESGGVR